MPAEFLKHIGNKGLELITKLINLIYKTGHVPNEFAQSIFSPIPKVRAAQECSDYRTISLISHTSKILLQIIKARIEPIIERNIGESQLGFRKGRGCQDAIFQLRILSERAIQKNRKIYACFIDYQKAFDRVYHDKLIEILDEIGVPTTERNIIKNLYWTQTAKIRINGKLTSLIEIKQGVRQGCILSPLLFNIYSEMIFQKAFYDQKGFKVNGMTFSNIRYADDTVIIAESQEQLQSILDNVTTISEEYNMKLNVKKTKVMVIERNPSTSCVVTVNGEELEQIQSYIYLGTMITSDGRPDKEIKRRISMAKSKFFQLGTILRDNISVRVKYKIIKCYVLSVLMYGCETWTMRKKEIRSLEAFEMWIYRKMNRIRWTDKISNEELLKMLDKERNLVKEICKRKIKYAGHIFRGSGEHSQLIIEGYIEGKRSRGRPRIDWMSNIKKWSEIKNYKELKNLALHRDEWRRLSNTINLQEETDSEHESDSG